MNLLNLVAQAYYGLVERGNNWLTVMGLAMVIISSILLAVFEINSLASIKITTYQPRTITYADRQLWSMTLRQKVASLLILHASGSRTAEFSQFLND